MNFQLRVVLKLTFNFGALYKEALIGEVICVCWNHFVRMGQMQCYVLLMNNHTVPIEGKELSLKMKKKQY
jgi:hypothetical protein